MTFSYHTLQNMCLYALLLCVWMVASPAYAQDEAVNKYKLRRALPANNSYATDTRLRNRPASTPAPAPMSRYSAQPLPSSQRSSEIYVRQNTVQPSQAPTPITAERRQVAIDVKESAQPVLPIPAQTTMPAPVLPAPIIYEQQPAIIIPAAKPAEIVEMPATVAPVETLPDIVDDTPTKVKYFDATANGPAPSFEAIAMQEIMPIADMPNELSRESEQILEQLPLDIFPAASSDISNAVSMNRNSAVRPLDDAPNFTSQSAIGADIAVKPQPLDVNYELEKAYNALLQGNTEIAVMIYNDVLTQVPKNRHALFGLATTYHKLGLLDKARPLYGTLLEMDPYDKETLNNFLALVGEEAPDSAIAYLEQLKVNNNDFSPIYAQLAQLYKKQGNLRSAISNMQQATALSPENMSYMYNLAVLYDANKDTRRAAALYNQLIKLGLRGKAIPASVGDIQERLTYLSSQ